ncbi:hypothetical protein ACEU6E_07340 [Halorutilales archaeon Cl-col2-1]
MTDTEPGIDYDTQRGRAEIERQPVLAHCNHYNRSLHQYIEDPNYIDSERVFLQSAAETAYLLVSEYVDRNDASSDEALEFAEEVFRFTGHGTVDFSDIGSGKVVSRNSHYARASKLNVGEREDPAEYFDKGFIAGTLKAAGVADGFDLGHESSISLGDGVSEYTVDESASYDWLDKTSSNSLPDLAEPPERQVESSVDEEEVVENVLSLGVSGNDSGLIPYFGVELTWGFADYYNKLSFRFENALLDQAGTVEIATDMLVEAGHICGFNTMGGIMKSEEWKAVVEPMIETRDDWLHGIVAVINALGWGVWRVDELVPGERLVVHVYEPYESVGHLKWFGESDHPVDYLAQGVASSVMNLLYHGDITEEPELDDSFYADLFSDKEAGFTAKQTSCVAMGDDYSEIIVEK